MSQNEDVVVKKVKPYPIVCSFEAMDSTKFMGNIVKLTLVGFLAELNETIVKVMDRHQCVFELPAVHHEINISTRVVKTYDQFRKPTAPPIAPDGKPVENPGSATVHLAEFHFQDLEFLQKEHIKRFLMAIGQAPR